MKRLFWLCAGLGPALLAQPSPQFTWEGEVDGVAVIHIRGRRVDVEDRQGSSVQHQRFRFFDRLPDSRQTVEVRVVEGRGNVRIVQQPRLENDYTASVIIEDRQSGASFYSIELNWDAGRGSYSDDPRPWQTGNGLDRLTWSGRVDGEILVRCRIERCELETISGQPVSRGNFRFTRPMPSRDVQISLDHTDGRGEIRLVEQPSSRNNYAAAVRIRDRQGGVADYSFVLSWQRLRRNEPDRLFTRLGVTWSGRVDGRVRVTVQERNARSEVVSGRPVSNERAQFEQSLPARGALTPDLRKVRGRGRAEIVEFPSNRNQYRLVFEIDDSSGGEDNYQVEVSW